MLRSLLLSIAILMAIVVAMRACEFWLGFAIAITGATVAIFVTGFSEFLGVGPEDH